MKVIAGEWRGRRLQAPRSTGTRPSSARLREALFSALGSRLDGSGVLDLFAGSGALGIEALSRGCATVEFVDLDPRALRTISANLGSLGADPSRFRIRRADAWRIMARWPEGLQGPLVVLADPPWTDDLPGRALPAAVRAVESGRVVAFALEHPSGAPEPDLPCGPQIQLRRHRHGAGAFTLITRSDP